DRKRTQRRLHLFPGASCIVAAVQALVRASVDDFGPPRVVRQAAHHGIRMHALVNADTLPALPIVMTPHHALTNGADENGGLFHSSTSLGWSTVLHAVKHLLGDLHGVGRGRLATAESHGGNHFADFLFRHPVV